MIPTKASLFKLVAARLQWLGERQVVLNQNIANADTPSYVPKDLRERDFARLVAGTAGRRTRIPVHRTDPGHIDGAPSARLGLAGEKARTVFEVAPAGNAVVLEEQMAKVGQTAMNYQLTSNLYQKYVGMVRTAIGQQG